MAVQEGQIARSSTKGMTLAKLGQQKARVARREVGDSR